jgi:hypothetical protein
MSAAVAPLPSNAAVRRCALSGLISGGLQPSQLIAVSRNPNSAAAKEVAQQGIEVRGGQGYAACSRAAPAL